MAQVDIFSGETIATLASVDVVTLIGIALVFMAVGAVLIAWMFNRFVTNQKAVTDTLQAISRTTADASETNQKIVGALLNETGKTRDSIDVNTAAIEALDSGMDSGLALLRENIAAQIEGATGKITTATAANVVEAVAPILLRLDAIKSEFAKQNAAAEKQLEERISAAQTAIIEAIDRAVKAPPAAPAPLSNEEKPAA